MLSEYFPGKQLLHPVIGAPSGMTDENFPAMHRWQEVAPSMDEKFPGLQEMHAAFPSSG
jgi:hypothetical protein